MTPTTLPIIDIAALWEADFPARQRIADEIGAACRLHGFFYVLGAPVAATLAPALLHRARAFFALPAAAKDAVAKGDAWRGYRRFDEAGATDWKEEYYAGRDGGEEANRWPAGEDAFRAAVLEYLEAMFDTAEKLFGALALSLSLPEDHFAAFCTDPMASIRLIRYPPAEGGGATGHVSKAHTDFGALTLLLQDQNGGLEVFDAATGDWIAARPVPGALVVNLGDLMARWTNDRYRSTLHRVINTAGADRISAPFFFSGAADYPIVCIPQCLAAGEAPLYAPTTVAEHERAGFQAVYARVPNAG